MKSTQMISMLKARSTNLLLRHARTLTRGFFLFFRASFVANFVAENACPDGDWSPSFPCELRFISAFTFSSCGSCSCDRGVQISSSRPVHCGRGTKR